MIDRQRPVQFDGVRGARLCRDDVGGRSGERIGGLPVGPIHIDCQIANDFRAIRIDIGAENLGRSAVHADLHLTLIAGFQRRGHIRSGGLLTDSVKGCFKILPAAYDAASKPAGRAASIATRQDRCHPKACNNNTKTCVFHEIPLA